MSRLVKLKVEDYTNLLTAANNILILTISIFLGNIFDVVLNDNFITRCNLQRLVKPRFRLPLDSDQSDFSSEQRMCDSYRLIIRQ